MRLILNNFSELTMRETLCYIAINFIPLVTYLVITYNS